MMCLRNLQAMERAKLLRRGVVGVVRVGGR